MFGGARAVRLGEVGDDVRRRAAAGDDVVNARLLRHVLAHHVDHVVHRLDPVERRAAAVGRRRRVRGHTLEAELRGDVRRGTRRTRLVAIPGMPSYRDVHVAEEPGAYIYTFPDPPSSAGVP